MRIEPRGSLSAITNSERHFPAQPGGREWRLRNPVLIEHRESKGLVLSEHRESKGGKLTSRWADDFSGWPRPLLF
jgi:hypothetical protein